MNQLKPPQNSYQSLDPDERYAVYIFPLEQRPGEQPRR